MDADGCKPRLHISMKKKILLAAGLFISIATFAQRITYGAGAGIEIANMRGDAVKNMQQLLNFTHGIVRTRPVTGFYAGGYANIAIGNGISVEPGLYFATKGYELSGTYSVKGIDILSTNATARLSSSYIEMPVLIRAQVNGFQFFAGPQISYLSNARVKMSAGIAGFNLLNSKMDVTSQMNRWDAAVTAGAGYQFTNGFRITAAYNRGLSKVNAGENIKSYNQDIRMGIGISF